MLEDVSEEQVAQMRRQFAGTNISMVTSEVDEPVKMPYPGPMCGDRVEFEAEWAASGKPDHERPDWPLPSFDAQDWAAAFCKVATNLGYKDAEGKPVDEGWMIGWFANALMRGFDEASSRASIMAEFTPEQEEAFKAEMEKPTCGHITWRPGSDAIGHLAEQIADIDADETPEMISARIGADATRLANMVHYLQGQLQAEGEHTAAANVEVERLRGIVQRHEMVRQQFKQQDEPSA